jgi:hypothetical protein
MDIETVVREVTVRGTVTGMDQVDVAYKNVGTSADSSATSMTKAGASAATAEAAIAKLGVQLQANAAQQAQYNDMVAQQSAALQQSTAANDNAQASYKSSGVELAVVVNHLRMGAEAAYAFSPAFRAVVNEMALPALQATGTALAVVAEGMVTGTNLAGTVLIKLGTAAETALPALTPITTAVKTAGASLEAFSPSIAGTAGSLLSFLAPALRLLGWFALAYDAIKLVGEAWTLAGTQMQAYIDISNKASAEGLSTDFFQRITKAADDAKLPVDALTAAIKTLNDSTADKLGGSTGQVRLTQLTTAGNFEDNPGVAQLANANTTEEKLRAISALIDQAMADGQRLAALDVAKTFLGDAVATNLAKDSDYLNKMIASADEIKASDLVPQEAVDNAVALQNRLDAAEQILSQRWHPIQDLLVEGGMVMKGIWVDIVEALATGFDWLTKWFDKINSPENQKAMNSVVNAQLEQQAQAQGLTYTPPDPAEAAMAAARAKLASGLQNPANISSAADQVNSIQNKVFPDTSKAVQALDNERDAYDRAVDAAQKHYAATNADTDAIGKGAGALAEFKTSAALLTAAQQSGITITQQVTDQINAYAKAAGTAAQANALMKASSAANFASQTLFMSPADLAAANVMHNIYGDDWQSHMDDALAKQLKMNNQIASAKTLADQLAGSFANDLVSGLLSGKSAMEALTTAANNLGKSLTSAGINNIIKDPTSGTGYIEAGVGILTQLFTGNDQAKQALQQAQTQWQSMTGQVLAFNQAAAGLTLGPLTNELDSLRSSFVTLVQAAAKAQDTQGQISLEQNFSAGVSSIVAQFEQGTQTLTPLATAIKGVNDEAQGLKDELASFDFSGVGVGIDAAAQAQITALIAQYTDQESTSLTQRLNTAQGNDYINSAQTVLTNHQTDLSNAAELGDPAGLMSQISATFAAEAQKVVNDAGLVGDQFNDFIKLFPSLSRRRRSRLPTTTSRRSPPPSTPTLTACRSAAIRSCRHRISSTLRSRSSMPN